MTVIKISSNILSKKLKINKLIKQTREWAYKHLVQLSVYNKYFDDYIEFNKSGIKHTLNAKSVTKNHIVSMFKLKELVAGAKYAGKEIPKKTRQNIIAIHVFQAILFIDDEKYKVRIIVREVSVNAREKSRNFFYHHHLIKKVSKS